MSGSSSGPPRGAAPSHTSPQSDAAHAWLERNTRPGGPLHPGSDRSTVALFRSDPVGRAKVRQALIEKYLAQGDSTKIDRGGRFAVYTAGPPGVGKSTFVNTHAKFATYRQVDSDDLKDLLLRQALSDGTFDLLLGSLLPDGKPLAPRELAGLVHHESTMLADDVRERCMARGENVVVHGTMQWCGYPAEALGRLMAHRYRRLDVISIEAPIDVVLDQARARWWTGRHEAGLGGRFTPEQAIREMYDAATTGLSRCRKNAADLVDAAGNRGIDAELLMVDRCADAATGT